MMTRVKCSRSQMPHEVKPAADAVFDAPPPFDAKRLEELANLLGLVPEWTIGFGEHDSEHDSAAYTLYEDEYHQAFITPGVGWPADKAEQDQVMLHELTHLFLADIAVSSANAVALLPKPSAKFAQQVLSREEELACDRISRAFLAILAKVPAAVEPTPVAAEEIKLKPTRLRKPKPGDAAAALAAEEEEED